MHHVSTHGSCRLCHRASTGALNGVEGLCAALGQNADQIDRSMGAAHRGLDRSRIAQIGLHGVDLAYPAERLQMPGQFRSPYRDPNAVVAFGQCAHDASSEKTRSAENSDQRVQIRGHGVSS